MTTEITMDFDPNLDIPEELKNVRIGVNTDVQEAPLDTDLTLESQEEAEGDEEDELGDTDESTILAVPESFTIISQTVRTAPDGTQVVDVVVDVDESPGATNYEVRISTQ